MKKMEERIVKLKWPIPVPAADGKMINVAELRLGRLKAKHLRLLPEEFMESEGSLSPADVIPLVAGLTGIPESSADEIDMEDLTEVADAMQSFFEVSLGTGKK